jgi:hypothetical protein
MPTINTESWERTEHDVFSESFHAVAKAAVVVKMANNVV